MIYRKYEIDFKRGTPGYNITLTAVLPDGREVRLYSGTDPDRQEMGPDDRAAWPEWAYMTAEERSAILRALDRAPAREGTSHCGRFRATIREAAVRVAVPVVGCRPGSWRREKLAVIDGEEPPKIEVIGLGADDWGAEADPWETEEERRRREAAREWERYGTVRVQVGDVVYDVGCAIGVPEYLRATAEAAGGDTTRPAYLAAWYVDASDWSLARGSDGSEGVPPELAGAVLGAISNAVVRLWREYQEERADYAVED